MDRVDKICAEIPGWDGFNEKRREVEREAVIEQLALEALPPPVWVYVVIYSDWEYSNIQAVYATKELAEQSIAERGVPVWPDSEQVTIEQWELLPELRTPREPQPLVLKHPERVSNA